MEPSTSLASTAQISLAIAGFAGIVAAFRNRAMRDWTVVEKFWLRLLLLNSILAHSFSLFGLFVLTVAAASPGTWRLCSLVALLCLLPYGAMIAKKMIGFGVKGLKAAGGNVAASFMLLGMLIVVCILQIWNAASTMAFWPFYAAILALILGAIYQFVRLVLRPKTAEDEI